MFALTPWETELHGHNIDLSSLRQSDSRWLHRIPSISRFRGLLQQFHRGRQFPTDVLFNRLKWPLLACTIDVQRREVGVDITIVEERRTEAVRWLAVQHSVNSAQVVSSGP